jgi:AcrR family transcriptional regulator
MTDAPLESRRRRPKGDKRARTRAKLIQIAAQLSEEKGYEHVTMQEVARRAGMSNGAIYGNFKNRDALLGEIGPAYWPQIRPQVSSGASVAEIMRAVAETLIAVMPARVHLGAGRLRGLAYALGNDALRAQGSKVSAGRYAAAVTWWRERFPDETQLPMKLEDLVRVVGALAEGLTFQRLITPELIPDELIYAAFAALAGERPKPSS